MESDGVAIPGPPSAYPARIGVRPISGCTFYGTVEIVGLGVGERKVGEDPVNLLPLTGLQRAG